MLYRSVHCVMKSPLSLAAVLVLAICASHPSSSDAQAKHAPQRSWEDIVKIRFNPAITKSVFTIPNTIVVDVLTEVSPREVILRTGATGTQVAESYREIGRTDKKTSGPPGFTRFTFRIASCENISYRIEATAVDGKNQKYIVSSQPIECKSPSARPILTISPVAEETLHLGRQYTLRWQGGDPNYPVTIVLSCDFCRGPVTLAEKIPNTGSFVFTMTRDSLREVDATTGTPGVGRYYLRLDQPDAGMNIGGRTPFVSISP